MNKSVASFFREFVRNVGFYNITQMLFFFNVRVSTIFFSKDTDTRENKHAPSLSNLCFHLQFICSFVKLCLILTKTATVLLITGMRVVFVGILCSVHNVVFIN